VGARTSVVLVLPRAVGDAWSVPQEGAR